MIISPPTGEDEIPGNAFGQRIRGLFLLIANYRNALFPMRVGNCRL